MGIGIQIQKRKNQLMVGLIAFFGGLMLLPAATCAAMESIFFEDNANVLDDTLKHQLQSYNDHYKQLPKKPQIMVITLNRLPEGMSIEDYSMKRAEELKVGDKKENSGLIYVVAVKDRKARLEVGYGLEETIPDALANALTDKEVKKLYKEEKYSIGVELVLEKVNRLLVGEVSAEKMEKNLGMRVSSTVIFVIAGVFGLLFGYFLIAAAFRWRKMRRLRKKYVESLSFQEEDGRKVYLPENEKSVNYISPRDVFYSVCLWYVISSFFRAIFGNRGYSDSYDSGSSYRSDGGFGSGDSFGGGSFGGGGGSSDW